jgi:hypothetical protein
MHVLHSTVIITPWYRYSYKYVFRLSMHARARTPRGNLKCGVVFLTLSHVPGRNEGALKISSRGRPSIMPCHAMHSTLTLAILKFLENGRRDATLAPRTFLCRRSSRRHHHLFLSSPPTHHPELVVVGTRVLCSPSMVHAFGFSLGSCGLFAGHLSSIICGWYAPRRWWSLYPL